MPALHPKQLEWTGGGPSGGALSGGPCHRLSSGACASTVHTLLHLTPCGCVHPLSALCPLSADQDLMYQGEGALPVLRLLLLYCAVHGGIPKRHFDNLRCACWPGVGAARMGPGCLSRAALPDQPHNRLCSTTALQHTSPTEAAFLPPCPSRDILNTYGHQHLLTLTSLAKAGACAEAHAACERVCMHGAHRKTVLRHAGPSLPLQPLSVCQSCSRRTRATFLCCLPSHTGLLQRREGRRSAFPAAKQQLRLLLQEGEAIDQSDPKVGARRGRGQDREGWAAQGSCHWAMELEAGAG